MESLSLSPRSRSRPALGPPQCWDISSIPAMAAVPAFPFVNSTVAPAPSAFWGELGKAPLPTCAPWQNFVLNNGTNPEAVAPYSVRLQRAASGTAGGAGISFGVPVQNVQPAFIIQAFIADLLLTTVEGLSDHRVSAFDDLSVTLSWDSAPGNSSYNSSAPGNNSSAPGNNSSAPSNNSSAPPRPTLTVPLVRGSPYLTFLFHSSPSAPATPCFHTIHAIVSLSSSQGQTRHRVAFNNGQTWLIYSSAPLLLQSNLVARAPFSGVIRVALVPQDIAAAEAVLDAHAPVYPLGGQGSLDQYKIGYSWDSASWDDAVAPSNLLMLSLPVHRRLIQSPSQTSPAVVPWSVRHFTATSAQATSAQATPPAPAALQYSTLDGTAVGTVGTQWAMQADVIPAFWHSLNGLRSNLSEGSEAALRKALETDVASLSPITTPSSYFHGKMLARASRLALIAEELEMSRELEAARNFLEAALTPWFNGSFQENAFLYDSVWGGVVPKCGAQDQGADFGAGMYNDHHFHYGYFIYSAAVLVKLKPGWGRQYKPQLYTLVRDYMTPQADEFFPKLRHFDFFSLHSWASGLFDFADGRNQESTSEAVHAYYGAALLGLAMNDTSLASLGATLASIETVATETLWHIPEDTSSDTNTSSVSSASYESASAIYPKTFASVNRVLGILWSNKRDAGLWFAPPQDLDKRTGIQVIPVTPYSGILFRNFNFARQLFNWTVPALTSTTDEWKGFSWALQAVIDPASAEENVRKLRAFDEGNSLSNLMWFALTQPEP